MAYGPMTPTQHELVRGKQMSSVLGEFVHSQRNTRHSCNKESFITARWRLGAETFHDVQFGINLSRLCTGQSKNQCPTDETTVNNEQVT